MARAIWLIASAWAPTLAAVWAAPEPTCSMTWPSSIMAMLVSVEARAWSAAPAATWPMVWAIWESTSDCAAASFTLPADSATLAAALLSSVTIFRSRVIM